MKKHKCFRLFWFFFGGCVRGDFQAQKKKTIKPQHSENVFFFSCGKTSSNTKASFKSNIFLFFLFSIVSGYLVNIKLDREKKKITTQNEMWLNAKIKQTLSNENIYIFCIKLFVARIIENVYGLFKMILIFDSKNFLLAFGICQCLMFMSFYFFFACFLII